jgi:hypothetical protein
VIRATLANSAWLAACLPEYRRFRRALGRVREEQEDVLRAVLRKNEESGFGRKHAFAAIRTVRDYQQRVALSDYEAYRAAVNRIAEGHAGVLTAEPVRLFEPTSGSAGAAKWIPYTQSLQAEFQRGIQAWVADLFLHNPDLLRGRAYWSVSPAEDGAYVTRSGIPVGFADDSEYVGGIERKLVQSVMAVPSSVRKVRDMEAFWRTTARHLAGCPDLRFVSVWNPTFLKLLADRLPEYCDRALRDAAPSERHTRLWPHLRMISCWTEGNSGAAAGQVADLFPQARVQGKGLIATEGFISLPWQASGAAVLAVRSHFLEFLPVDSQDEADATRPQLAHELEDGQRYSVVLTSGGGLYRYHLGDIVEVLGRERQCPLVRFVGRKQISDWCGEKLHETHAARVLASAFADGKVRPEFAMLACDTEGAAPGYVLYCEAEASKEKMGELAILVETGLEENYHYRYARRLGQLGKLRVFAARDAGESYLAACIARGQRAGNAKPVALDPRDGWTAKFEGRFVED